MKIIERAKKARLNVIESLNETAEILKEKGNYKEEINVRKQAIVKIKELVKEFDTGREELLQMMSDMATAYENMNQYDKAVAVRKDVLDQCMEWFDDWSVEATTAMQLLSSTFIKIGKYGEALAYDYDVYLRKLKLYGPDDEETLDAVMNYAGSYYYIGQYNTALFLDKQNYEDVVRIYGKNSPQAYVRLGCIATVLNAMERYEEALPLWERIEEYNRQRFGKKDETTFDSMRRVALTLNNLGQHEEAQRRLEKIIEKETREIGHAKLVTKASLAKVLMKTGRYNKAIGLLQEVLKKRRQKYGEKHIAYILILNRLAYAWHLKGDIEKERSCVKQLEQILEDRLIENAENEIETQDTLIRLYIDSGEFRKAAILAVKMIDSAEYHYFYKKKFLAGKYDTAKLAFEKAGDLDKSKEYEYKKTHMNELIYSGKPLCGMKLKAIKDEGATCLTKGKIYELLGIEKFGNDFSYSIFDDEEFVPYQYAPELFTVVDDGKSEPFPLDKEEKKVVDFQQIDLCDYNKMKATILEDGTFSISGIDETWKALAFMTFDDDGCDNDDYDFSYDFTKKDTKELFALLQGKNYNSIKTDAELAELLNIEVIQKRFASKEGVDQLFEFCEKHGIEFTERTF